MKLDIQLFGGRGASSSSNGRTSLEKIKSTIPNSYFSEGNIKYIQATESIDKWRQRQQEEYNKSERKNANDSDVTEEFLNNNPVKMEIFSKDGNYVYTNIYKNRSDLMKSVTKEYGGLSQLVGTGKEKSQYSIGTATKKGEFYLKRNKYAKGGWVWKDQNDEYVGGTYKSKTFRKK